MMKLSLFVLAFGICAYADDLPKPNMFTRLSPGQLKLSEYESLMESKGWRSGFREDSKTAIRDSDIILTPKQYMQLFKEEKKGANWRKAEINENRRWTDAVVPWTINAADFNEQQTRELHKAMETLSQLTCLTFRPKREGDKNWVKFTDGGGGCNSQLGMMNWGEQAVNLGSGCKWRGLYFHEIGHALGLIHEHQRPDRDEHVKVVWRRVKNDFLDAFTLYRNDTVNYFGNEYDVSSIMHYEPEAFNDNQEYTVIPKQSWHLELMFRVYYKTLSFTDTRILNQMYKCGKCSKSCPANSYLDKNCNCVTPKDIHDALCINERPDAECYDRVKQGHCNAAGSAAEMNIHCRKACGSCPTYGMRDYVEPRLSRPYDACEDRYHEPERCRQWAAAGDCDRYPHWMKRNCRKSCNACNFDQGRCRNYYKGAVDDEECDRKAREGQCNANNPLIMAGCQGSCRSCGYQLLGKCEDDFPGSCPEPAERGECDDNNPIQAAHVQTICRKSCNSCFMDRGNCTNTLSDYECRIGAAQGKCRTDPEKYKRDCRKTCDSCDYGIKDPSCEDIHPAWMCDGYFRKGTCNEEKGYAWRFCASSCNKCAWARNPTCEDFHDDCAPWTARGECVANHQWMSTHCARSCNTCDRYRLGLCFNTDHDAFCEVNAKHGSCEKFADQMKRDCKRSCKHCQAAPLEKSWECKDLSSNCDYWKGIGECTKNPVYLEAFCHNACGHCRAG